jgi:ADP-ribose pyrophosphatase
MSAMTDDERPTRAADAGDRHLEETRIDGKRVYDGAMLHVRCDTVRLPDGGTATREYVVHPGAVLVVPMHADGRLIVERQFRYPLNRVLVEFPAGKIDPGEPPLAAAQRELLEEAGYTAERWTHVGRIHPVVGYSSEVIEIFVAEDLLHVGRQLDHGEFLDLDTMTVDAMLDALDRGEITDGKTVAALFLYLRRAKAR